MHALPPIIEALLDMLCADYELEKGKDGTSSTERYRSERLNASQRFGEASQPP